MESFPAQYSQEFYNTCSKKKKKNGVQHIAGSYIFNCTFVCCLLLNMNYIEEGKLKILSSLTTLSFPRKHGGGGGGGGGRRNVAPEQENSSFGGIR